MCTKGWHGTHSSSCLTRVYIGAPIFFTAAMIHAFKSARSRDLVCRRVLCVLCMKCTLYINHRLTPVILQHTKQLLPRSGHFLTTYQSHRLAAEMWTTIKNNGLGEKNVFSCSFYLYRFRKCLSYGFPIINFCNPGVHYEKACILTFSRLMTYIYI